MAVHFATSSDYAQRTTGLLPHGSDSTVMLWVRFDTVSVLPAYQTPYIIIDAPGTYTDYVAFFGTTTDLRLDGNMTPITTTAPTASVWYHLCWVQFGTTQQFYVNGVLKGNQTYNRAGVVVGDEFLGNDTFSDGNLDCAYFRSWSGSALAAFDILLEMGAPSAVQSTNLWMDTPLTSDLNDISGNGRNWTGVGSQTFVAGPTLPSNAVASSAIALSTPPQSLTLDFGQGSTAWYSYTPSLTSEVELGFWAFYDFTKVDDLQITVYAGSPSSLTLWPNLTNGIDRSSSVPYQLPLQSGITIYIRLSARTASVLPFTSTIAVSTLPGPTDIVPVGAIAVNDDLTGFPLALLNQTTGVALQFVQLVAGGSGVIMTDGLILLDDGTANYVCYLNTASGYVQQWTLPFLHGSTAANTKVTGTDGSTLFYIRTNNVGGTCKIDTVNRSGAVVGTTYSLANGVRAAAPNDTNTILYYALAGTNQAIKRWDLVGNVAMADLIAGVVNYQNSVDLLVLADGSVITGYMRTAPSDTIIKHISAAGAVLDTYTSFLSSGVTTTTLDHLCSAIDDPVSFWAWFHNDTNAPFASTFYNITVAGGAKSAVDAQQFEQGQYGGDFTTAPNAHFGHSNSCPFWINRVAIAPPSPTPLRSANEYLIRRERWFPVLSHEQFRQFFSKLQIDLQAGNGLGNVDSTTVGFNPLMELDWSDDGGWTWSSIRFMETGKVGAYGWRPITRQLGYGRNRVFRIAVSDPVQWVVINGYLDAVLGTS